MALGLERGARAGAARRGDGGVHGHDLLAALGEGRRQEVWEEALDEGEDEHVPQRRERDDEDDHEGHQRHKVFEDTPQQLHLQQWVCRGVPVGGCELRITHTIADLLIHLLTVQGCASEWV